MIAALFVETNGVYYGLDNIDPWDEKRDARNYSGPYPVIAHPPCQRWGRFWHGSTSKPHQFKIGEDSGCFATALIAVRNYGGVLEHPAGSLAWKQFGLNCPKLGEGWIKADRFGGYTCSVEQGHYGHFARKQTWLYAAHVDLPELIWTASAQRINPKMVDRYGYEKARKIGVVAMIGGKNKTKIRNATPEKFRDLLISIAKTAQPRANYVTK